MKMWYPCFCCVFSQLTVFVKSLLKQTVLVSGPPNGLCPEPSDNSDGEQQGIKFMSKTACLSDKLNDYNLTDMFFIPLHNLYMSSRYIWRMFMAKKGPYCSFLMDKLYVMTKLLSLYTVNGCNMIIPCHRLYILLHADNL